MLSRILTLLAVTALTGAMARAADDSFVGKWKLNPEKSQFAGLTYKIEDAGNDKYRFSFGDDIETIPFDGKDHQTKYGNTWAIKKTGANSWTWTRKRDGKVTGKATWTVSEDGQIFTSAQEVMRPDGSNSHNETKMKRTDGTAGLVGTWESTETKIGSPTTIGIAKWQEDGYAISDPAYKEHLDLKLDGKEYTDKGPQVAKGMTVSGKQVDDHNIELTYKLKDKAVETDKWELSADGKTLTNTVTFPGESKPEVDVYDRK